MAGPTGREIIAMTSKHFRALAAELADARPDAPAGSPARAHWERDTLAIADACYASNGRFDRGRFLRACGWDVAS